MTTPDRAARATALIAQAGWQQARRAPLAGDASNRKYERLTAADGNTAVLMDADPALGEDVRPFLAIARHLTALGLSAPEILAADNEAGFLLIEDLGDGLFARLIADTPELENSLYSGATDVLLRLHAAALPEGVAAYDATLMGDFAAHALRWYLPGASDQHPSATEIAAFAAEIAALKEKLAPGSPVLVLRDYHAENLLWLPERPAAARVGLLDFQDAMAGPRAYDLVSMLQDARRDVSPATETAMIARYCAGAGCDPEQFAAEYAFCGAQRNLRIIGVFARLCLRDAKPHYLGFLPRVWALLQRDLAHPALAGLSERVTALLPPPETDVLQRIAGKCGSFRGR